MCIDFLRTTFIPKSEFIFFYNCYFEIFLETYAYSEKELFIDKANGTWTRHFDSVIGFYFTRDSAFTMTPDHNDSYSLLLVEMKMKFNRNPF